MAYGIKFDEPPLLSPGRHFFDLADVERLCVAPFTNSTTRRSLYQKLEELVQELLRRKVVCDLMIDGSFLTRKLNPKDIDVAVHIQNDFSENVDDKQNELLGNLTDDNYIQGLDTFVEVEYPRDHASYPEWKEERSWGEQWGIQHDKLWCKGVVVLRLWETNVGLRIRR